MNNLSVPGTLAITMLMIGVLALVLGALIQAEVVSRFRGLIAFIGLALVGVGGGAWLAAKEPAIVLVDTITVPVLNRPIGENQLIDEKYITTRRFPLDELPKSLILSQNELSGRMALEVIRPLQPILRSQISNHVTAAVPKNFIPRGQAVTVDDFTTLSFPINKIVTDTILTADEKIEGAIPLVHLSPHQPIVLSALQLKAKQTVVFVAQEGLSPYHVIKAGEAVTKTVDLSPLSQNAAATVDGQMLINAKKPGDIILASDVIRIEQQRVEDVIVIATDRNGALNGALEPGDVVEVYISEVLDDGSTTTKRLAADVLILNSVRNGRQYLITLGTKMDDAATIISAAAGSRFTLVVQPET